MVDLTGRLYGKWTVLERAAQPGRWRCRCACGRVADLQFTWLKTFERHGVGCDFGELSVDAFLREAHTWEYYTGAV